MYIYITLYCISREVRSAYVFGNIVLVNKIYVNIPIHDWLTSQFQWST